MRHLLRQWNVGGLGDAVFPERPEVRPLAVDRWLAWWAGRVTLLFSPVLRWYLRRFANKVIELQAELEPLSDAELADRAMAISEQLARRGLPRELVVEAFACVREASFRRLGKRHFPVQIMGAYALLRGNVAEMATGEGKSLTGALAAATVAMARVPVHVVTVNDYLARRDAEEMQPLFGFLGLRAGWIESEQSPAERRSMYACDITYCVNKDLVFDYLKDGLGADRDGGRVRQALQRFLNNGSRPDRRVLRGLCFAIVDEADSIFIDEARTPLIISAQGAGEGEQGEELTRALEIAGRLPPAAWRLLEAERSAVLTPDGRELVEQFARGFGGRWRFRRAREQMVEQALAALHLYVVDRQYIVSDGKVQIVDESTGRTMPDRSWEHGLHQLIEIKEGLERTAQRDTISRMTYQRFFSRYLWLAGMSGTGAEVAPEVRSVYGVDTVRIPTHRPVMRRHGRECVYLDRDRRWEAVVSRICEEIARGRAVLVGTRSVDASEHLSSLLSRHGVEHSLLNARHDAEEASIVTEAGRPGRVSVATNMAGRGTDIKLDPQVLAAGGLHVILTEFHETRRVDRQLFGRAGRQGDPGSCESLVALDDELFRTHVPGLARALAIRYASHEQLPGWLAGPLRVLAQASAERRNARVRKRTLEGEKQKFRSLAFAGGME